MPRRSFSLVLLCLQLLAPPAAGEQQQATPPGFSPLFNGEDLSGWCGREHIDPDEYRSLTAGERAERDRQANISFRQHWRVANGEIINDGHGVFCTTQEEFGDFELLLQWKMTSPGTDSGN